MYISKPVSGNENKVPVRGVETKQGLGSLPLFHMGGVKGAFRQTRFSYSERKKRLSEPKC